MDPFPLAVAEFFPSALVGKEGGFLSGFLFELFCSMVRFGCETAIGSGSGCGTRDAEEELITLGYCGGGGDRVAAVTGIGDGRGEFVMGAAAASLGDARRCSIGVAAGAGTDGANFGTSGGERYAASARDGGDGFATGAAVTGDGFATGAAVTGLGDATRCSIGVVAGFGTSGGEGVAVFVVCVGRGVSCGWVGTGDGGGGGGAWAANKGVRSNASEAWRTGDAGGGCAG